MSRNIAIILAAGRGNRLRPLTDRVPKCMVATDDGVPLVHRAVRKLEGIGVTDVVVGVGFEKEAVVLPPETKICVHRVANDEWDRTNNIRTLQLCFEYLEMAELVFDNVFLIEGDVYLGDNVLGRLLLEPESAAAVLPASYTKKGACVSVDASGYVRNMMDNAYWNDPGIFKAANVYKLTAEAWRAVGERLGTKGASEYYEAIIAELLGKVKLRAVIDGDCREIDNSYDHFSLRDSLHSDYETTRLNWGGLWRVPVQDHFLLANPFYPTPFIKDRLRYSLDTLITNYPSSRVRLNQMLRAFCNVDAAFPLFAVNGASEGIRVLEGYFANSGVAFKLQFSPTFGEYLRFPTAGQNNAEGLIVVSPNNPTAETVSVTDLERLLSRWRYVLLDLSLDVGKDTIYLDLLKRHKNLIIVRSLSKIFGVPGIRIGYVAVHPDCIPDFEDRLPIWNVNSVMEQFLELHLDSLSDYERSIEQWRLESARLKSDLAALEIGQPLRVDATIPFISLTGRLNLAHILFENYGVFVADISKKFKDGLVHTRIGVKSPKQNNYLIYAIREAARVASRNVICPEAELEEMEMSRINLTA